MWPCWRLRVTGNGFDISKAQARVSHFLFPENPDVELSAISPTLCMPVCCHAACHDDNGLKLKASSTIRVDLVMESLVNRTLIEKP